MRAVSTQRQRQPLRAGKGSWFAGFRKPMRAQALNKDAAACDRPPIPGR